MENPNLVQVICALLAILSALGVVLARNLVMSAMSLMATLFLTGGLYFGLCASFIGAVQILIYAGAIAVLFVFIVMLLDIKEARVSIPGRRAQQILALVGAAVFSLGLFMISRGVINTAVTEKQQFNDAGTISMLFLSKYMLCFQVTGFLILAAVIGVVVLAKKRTAR